MAQAPIAHILQEIRTLPKADLRLVQKAVQEQLEMPTEQADLKRVYQAMLTAGLLTEIKPALQEINIERPLVPIQGKPLSETIIEERR